jgi:hypothetical protein
MVFLWTTSAFKRDVRVLQNTAYTNMKHPNKHCVDISYIVITNQDEYFWMLWRNCNKK